MGVSKFTKVFSRSKKVVDLYDFKGKTIAIDANYELHRCKNVVSEMESPDGEYTGYLKTLLNIMLKYINFNIILVYVFDNPIATPLKNEELEKRKKHKEREIEKKKCLEERARGDESDEELIVRKCRTRPVDKLMFKRFYELLDYMGIAHFTSAPEVEGDKLAVALQDEGYVDGILTADIGDSIAFGAKYVLSPISGKPAKLNMIVADELFDEYNINYEEYVEMSIALGTDFAPKSVGIGEKTIFTKSIILTKRQLEAKEYFMQKLPKKLRKSGYTHKKYSAEKLSKFLTELGFSGVDKIIQTMDKYYAAS